MDLRFRLNLAIALSMFLIVAAGTVFTVYTARQAVRLEVRSSVNLGLQSVEAGLSEAAAAADPLAYWRGRLGFHEKTRHLRVRIEAADGRPVDLFQAAPQDAPPAPAWFTWWVRPQTRGETRRFASERGAFSITVSDDPNDEIAEAWGEARGFFGLIILQALLVCVLVQISLGRALRSVPMILKGLEGLEAGDYRERLPDSQLPEFSRIARAFNHAASALEKAHRENRALARRTLTVQEDERRMLARELHDELGQSLTGIKVIAASIRKDDPDNRAAVDSIVSICDHLFAVVRSMMRRLRPTMLDELGLAAALEDMIDSWREQNRGVEVDLHCEDAVETCAGTTKIHLFRIVQESLSNVARHARANRVEVRLELLDAADAGNGRRAAGGGDWVRLCIVDNGIGLGTNGLKPGFGLLGMRERAESLGGSFHVRSRQREGVALSILVPCGEGER